MGRKMEKTAVLFIVMLIYMLNIPHDDSMNFTFRNVKILE